MVIPFIELMDVRTIVLILLVLLCVFASKDSKKTCQIPVEMVAQVE